MEAFNYPATLRATPAIQFSSSATAILSRLPDLVTTHDSPTCTVHDGRRMSAIHVCQAVTAVYMYGCTYLTCMGTHMENRPGKYPVVVVHEVSPVAHLALATVTALGDNMNQPCGRHTLDTYMGIP